jgi:VCBS repeat-containing protein
VTLWLKPRHVEQAPPKEQAPTGVPRAGLSVSTDGGASFTNKTTANGLGSNSLYGVYADGSNVYVGTVNNGVSKAAVTVTGTAAVAGSGAFTDPAGRTLTYATAGTSTGGGTVSINSATGAFTYTPTAAQRAAATGSTTDTFTITASNGVNTKNQVVTVSVAPA